MIKQDRLKEIIKRTQNKRILVVGDILVDQYIFTDTNRISREAPVLILKHDREEIIPGGAANSVNNIKALGGNPIPVGVIGDDETGKKLIRIFKEKNINCNGIIIDKKSHTTVKTRIMAGGYHTSRQQVVRVDKEPKEEIGTAVENKIIGFIKKNIKNVDAVLISDYGYGTLKKSIRETLLNQIKTEQKLSVVDSRYNLTDFKNVTIVTPNEIEAGQAVDLEIKNEKDLKKVGKILLTKLNSKGILITRGRLGMALFEKNGDVSIIPVNGTDEAVDATGAGDTVAGILVLSLSSGASLLESSLLANYTAGIVVMKRGTATASKEEVLSAINGKIQ
jgi:rfaE bifunctional protein kinase chain/domain